METEGLVKCVRVEVSRLFYLKVTRPRRAFQILRMGPRGTSSRGIGNSFQLAITTPRLNLIGYGTASAQS